MNLCFYITNGKLTQMLQVVTVTNAECFESKLRHSAVTLTNILQMILISHEETWTPVASVRLARAYR